MNHVYRLVWNASSGCWAAVAETARTRSKRSSIAGLVVAALLGGQALAAPPLPPPSVTLTGQNNATAYVAANGTTVVNISTPNAAGLSHNYYQQYNVNSSGLVLNNDTTSTLTVQSQLAGQLFANLNLGVPAKVILNEVVGNNRSTLAGFTEVAGNKADVIVANPYGITCSGCGFINTDRVTLSTGMPVFGSSGALTGFSVQQGDILVDGSGLNGSGQQILDLVTRAIVLQAPINSHDLGIVTGSNSWDYLTRSVSATAAGTGTPVAYAIDSSVLGGMYVDRIHLIATENGAGVRLLGDAAAGAGDFTLSAAGTIELHGHVSAKQNLAISTSSTATQSLQASNATLTAGQDLQLLNSGGVLLDNVPLVAGGSISLTGTSLSANAGISAGQNLDLALSGDVLLSGGGLLAGQNLSLTGSSLGDSSLGDSAGSSGNAADALRSAGGSLTVAIGGAATLDGTSWLAAGGDWQGSFGSLSIAAGNTRLAASGALSATASNGDMDLSNARVQAGADLSLMSSGTLNTVAGSNQAIDSRSGTLSISAGAGLNNAGNMVAEAGAATLRSGNHLDNSGLIEAAGDLTITDLNGGGSENLSNSHSIISGAALSLQGNAITNTAGASIQARTSTTAQLGSLGNAGNWLLSVQPGSGIDQITASGAVNNASGATLQSANAFMLAGNSIDNAGNLLAQGSLQMNLSDHLSNTGLAQAGGILGINAANVALVNQGKLLGDGLVFSLASLSNTNTIVGGSYAASSISVGGALNNQSGALLKMATAASGGGTLNATSLSNAGALQSDGNMNMNIASALTVNSPVVVKGNLNISGNGFAATVNSTLEGDSSLTMTNADSLTLSASGIMQGGNLNLGIPASRIGVLNMADGAEISATDGLNLYAVSLNMGGTNTKILGAMGGSGLFTLDLSNALNNPGMLFSGADLSASAAGITNTSSGGMLALNDLTLNAKGSNLNNSGTLYSKNNLTVTNTATLSNIGTYSSLGGSIKSDNNIVINASNVNNSSSIQAGKDIHITATTAIVNKNVGNINIGQGSAYNLSSVTNNLNGTGDVSAPGNCIGVTIFGGGPAGCSIGFGAADAVWNASFSQTYQQDQYYVGGKPFVPQIISDGGGGSIALSFQTASNVGGLISASTINLSGIIFTNQQDSLLTTSYTHTWDKQVVFKAEGPLTNSSNNDANDKVITGPSTQAGGSILAGVYANSLTGSVLLFSNNGSISSTSQKNGNAQSAAAVTHSTEAAATPLGTVTAGKPDVALQASGFTTLTGIDITLPTSPNGYFVLDQSPNAKYLVETNPLLGTGSSYVGASLLEAELGINPDAAGKLVGDNNYQAYLTQQQLIAQTGNDLLNGYNSLAAQMLGLTNNALAESGVLGLSFGVAPSPAQLDELSQDIVWMVKTEVAGQSVLVPVVYLSATTKAGILSGAVIDAANIDLNVGTLSNTGGTIEASDTMTIVASGNITNTSGSMSADNMALVSTQGKVIDQTVVNRYGDDKNYADVAGQTGSISAKNNLIISGSQGVDVIGASVSAGKSAVLYSDQGNINVQSLALSSKSSTETQSGDLFSHSSQKTVTTDQTLQGASVSAGAGSNPDAQLTLLAGKGAVNLGSANLGSSGGINIKADSVNSTVVELTSSKTSSSQSSGISASGGTLTIGSSSANSNEQSTVASGSTVTAGGALNIQANRDITLTGGNYTGDTVSLAGSNIITKAAQDTFTSSSSSAAAGLSAGNGSLSVGGSNSSHDIAATTHDNATITAKNGVALAAQNTVDIGGVDIAVLNKAPAPDTTPASDSDSDNTASSTGKKPEPVTPGFDVAALASAAAAGKAGAFISDTAATGMGATAAMADMAKPGQGQLAISGAQIVSTKAQDSYQETKQSSSTSIGVGTHAQSSDSSASAGISLSFQDSRSKETLAEKGDTINHLSADNVSLQGKNSIDLKGVDIKGDSSVDLQSQGNITIAAASVEKNHTLDKSSTGITVGLEASANDNPQPGADGLTPMPAAPAALSANLNIGHQSQTLEETENTHQDSTLSSGGTLNIQSGNGDVTWTGVTAVGDSVNIQANNFNSAAYQDSSTHNESNTALGLNLTASTDLTQSVSSLFHGNGASNTTLSSNATTQVGNTLAANNATITVKDKVTLVGGTMAADNVNIQANTVDIQAAKSTLDEHSTSTTASLTMSGSAGLEGNSASASIDSLQGKTEFDVKHSDDLAKRTADDRVNNGKAVSDQLLSGKTGLTISTSEETTKAESYSNANLQFKNLTIDTTAAAGSGKGDGHVDIGGANLLATDHNSSINITTGELDTTKYVDKSETTRHDNSTFIGISTEAHSAVADTVNHSTALADKSKEGMTIDPAWAAAQAAGDATNMAMGDLAGASAAATITNTDTQSHSLSTAQNTNYINAGAINITTTKGDINLNGVQFNAPPSVDPETGVVTKASGPRAQSIALNSAGDVNMTAARSTHSETSTTLSNDLSLTAAASASMVGSGASVQAGYNGSVENNSLASTAYGNSSLSADQVSIKSQNLNMAGANVTGGQVNVDVAHDINISSVQDTQQQSTGKGNWGGSIGVATTVLAGGVQGGGGDSHDNFAKTSNQSGINADNNLNIAAGGNLALTGAHIASAGTGSVDIKGNVTANQLNDYHEKDGLFAGASAGFGPGVNGGVNLEKVDQVHSATTQNATISGANLSVGGKLQGDNLQANGSLQTQASTVTKNERIAGVYVNATVAKQPGKEKSGAPEKAATHNNEPGKTPDVAPPAAHEQAMEETPATGHHTPTPASPTPEKKPDDAGSRTTDTPLPTKPETVAANDGPPRTGAETPTDGPAANKSKYDTNVVIITRGKDGKIKDDVRDSALALAGKHPENTIVLTEKEGGGLEGVEKLAGATGNIRVNTVGHGADLKGQSDKIVGMVQEVRKNTGDATIAKVGIVACGGCSKEHDESLAKSVATQLHGSGLSTVVTERSGGIQVNENGTKSASDGEGKQSFKTEYTMKGDSAQAKQLEAKRQVATLERPLTFLVKKSEKDAGVEMDHSKESAKAWDDKVVPVLNEKLKTDRFKKYLAEGITKEQIIARAKELAESKTDFGTISYDKLLNLAAGTLPYDKPKVPAVDSGPFKAPGDDAPPKEAVDLPKLLRKNSNWRLVPEEKHEPIASLKKDEHTSRLTGVGGSSYRKLASRHFVSEEGTGTAGIPDTYKELLTEVKELYDHSGDTRTDTEKNKEIAGIFVAMFTRTSDEFPLNADTIQNPVLRDYVQRIYTVMAIAEVGGRSSRNMPVIIAAFSRAAKTGDDPWALLKDSALFVHTDETTKKKNLGGSKMSQAHWDGKLTKPEQKNEVYKSVSAEEKELLLKFAQANGVKKTDDETFEDAFGGFLQSVTARGLDVMASRLNIVSPASYAKEKMEIESGKEESASTESRKRMSTGKEKPIQKRRSTKKLEVLKVDEDENAT
jgi:filamentous hemagglutinin family protein